MLSAFLFSFVGLLGVFFGLMRLKAVPGEVGLPLALAEHAVVHRAFAGQV